MSLTGVEEDYLTLLDWRRRVSTLYAGVRGALVTEPLAAHALWRAGRDELFGKHPQSALPEEARVSFRGLRYFAYDKRYALSAPVRPLPHERFDVPTSTEGVIPFVRFGAVDLEFGSLEVFWLDAYGGGVFIPFRDATSGTTTYGGGRYLLDTAKGADLGSIGDRLVLDFNFSYHPSCVYDPKWICPLAPLSNRLAVAIEAGERTS